MVRWLGESNSTRLEVLKRLRNMSFENRFKHPQSKRYVQSMYDAWYGSSNKIERLAVLDWKEAEILQVFCNMLEQMDSLIEQYNQEKQTTGNSVLANENFDSYMKASLEEIKRKE